MNRNYHASKSPDSSSTKTSSYTSTYKNLLESISSSYLTEPEWALLDAIDRLRDCMKCHGDDLDGEMRHQSEWLVARMEEFADTLSANRNKPLAAKNSSTDYHQRFGSVTKCEL